MGAVEEHQNKDRRVVSWETAGSIVEPHAADRLSEYDSRTELQFHHGFLSFLLTLLQNPESAGKRRTSRSSLLPLLLSFIKCDLCFLLCINGNLCDLISTHRWLPTTSPSSLPSSRPLPHPCFLLPFSTSITQQQITICLQPLGHSPQLFWHRSHFYLY